MGRHFHHGCRDALGTHRTQYPLQIKALGCRVHGPQSFVRVADLDRPDQADRSIRTREDRLDEIAAARLAIRSRDAYEGEFARGFTEETSRDWSHRSAAVGDRDDRDGLGSGGERVLGARLVLDEQCRRAELQGGFEVVVSIAHCPDEGHEEVARRHVSRVVRDPANYRVGGRGAARGVLSRKCREQCGQTHQPSSL